MILPERETDQLKETVAKGKKPQLQPQPEATEHPTMRFFPR